MQTHKTAKMFSAFLHEKNTDILVSLQSKVPHRLFTEATWKTSNGKEKHDGNCPKYVHCICQFINDLEHNYNLKGNGIEVKYMIVLLNPSI